MPRPQEFEFAFDREEPTRPRASIPLKEPKPQCTDVRELGRRGLREAVILLAKKVAELGVDVSEVTEMLGVRESDPGARGRPETEFEEALRLVDGNSTHPAGK